jgi:uncharacterized protein (DUF1501 family)
MKRRLFLTNAIPLTVISAGMLNSALRGCNLTQLSAADKKKSEADGRVLVLVQLEGGNDGLNTVIPLDQYANLINARKNLIIPENKVLPLNNTPATGLHPAMGQFQNIYANKELTIVQGVGYSNPDLSHFKAMDIWDTGSDASSASGVPTGWLGRFLDLCEPIDGPPAIQIDASLSKALQGHMASMGMVVKNTNSFYNLNIGHYHIDAAPASDSSNKRLDALRNTIINSKEYLKQVATAAGRQKNLSSKYPSPGTNKLADQLKIVAQLIGGGLQTKAYLVSLHGFDTHAGQADTMDTQTGVHADLLGKLSQAVSAFQDDLCLMNIQNRVVGMIYSEFGRRIKSNTSLGTDHGTAAPVMLFGTKLKGGLIGSNPEIASKVYENDNLPLQHDFRSIYASVLQGWFNLSAKETNGILLDSYPDLNLFKA